MNEEHHDSSRSAADVPPSKSALPHDSSIPSSMRMSVSDAEELPDEFWEETSECSADEYDEELANELTVEQYHEHLRSEVIHPSQWILQRGLAKVSERLRSELHLVWLMTQKLRRDSESLVGAGAGAAPPIRLHHGDMLGEKLRVLEFLSAGSYGDLYRAWHVGLNGHMAVKVLHRGISLLPEDRQWLEREGRLGKPAVDYPHIAVVLQTGHERGQDFLVMDYVPGCDLARLVRSRGTLPWEEACEYFRQVVRGLVHAHRLGRYPMALRPSHMIRVGEGTVRLVDWGYDKLQVGRPSATLATNLPDTGSAADYTAPEWKPGQRPIDIRAGFYSLGCSLFQMLVGTPPFAAHKTVDAKLQAHATIMPARLSSLGHSVPERVQLIVDRLMAKSPADRYDSAEDLLRSLDRLLERHGERPLARTREVVDSAKDAKSVPRRFFVTRGPKRGTRFQPSGETATVVVGRGKKASWRVAADEALSREHFRLEFSPGSCRLVDLQSSNGTFVNDQRVTTVELFDGDVIAAGNTILMGEESSDSNPGA